MKKDLPKLGYVMKKVNLNKRTIKSFVSDEESRRKIRKGKVSEFISLLQKGEHFSAPFVVNAGNTTNKIIDGNHRFEAICECIKSNSAFNIDIWMAEYKALSPEHEREVFNVWNSGTKQTTDDWLKIWFETIPLGKELISKIPSTIYGGPNKIKTRIIVGAHIISKKKRFTGAYSTNGEKLVSDLRELTMEDIKYMSAFMKDMEMILGPFDATNIFWKQTAITAFYKLWYDNVNMSRAYFLKRFVSLLNGAGVHAWKIAARSSGTEATRSFYFSILQALNSKGKQKFVSKTED